jgi:transposase
LALVLQALSDNAHWSTFESALTQQLVRVYALRPERVRLDSTTASGSWAVTPEGLFQFGHSKDHRPDLPQVKVMLSTLDPLGLPLATTVVPGHHADDPLYIPAVKQVRASLGQRGLLYVGDCKMAALETRAFLHAGQDFYLCPLSALQAPADLLEAYLAPIWTGQQDVTPIYRHRTAGDREQIAEGYEVQGHLVFGHGVAQQVYNELQGFVPRGALLSRHTSHEPKPFPQVDHHDSTAAAPHRGLRRDSRLSPPSGQTPSLARYTLAGLLCDVVWLSQL